MKKTKCAFYGSLRRPLFNYDRLCSLFGDNNIIYKSTTKIEGYELYLINTFPKQSTFPGIIDSSKDNTIVVDLFELSYSSYAYVLKMEESAGYYEDEVIINGEIYKIFVYAGSVEEKNRIVYGDFLKYMNGSPLTSSIEKY